MSLMWDSAGYRAAYDALGGCPVESGHLGHLADGECSHGHLPTDGRITCGCWAVQLQAAPDEPAAPARPAKPRHAPTVTAQHVREMRRLYDLELTCQQIGDHLGWSRFTVAAALRRDGVRFGDWRARHNRTRSRFDVGEVQRAADLYEEGLSLREIAGRLCMSEQAVGNRVKAAGVPLRPRGGPRDQSHRKDRQPQPIDEVAA